MSFPRTSELVGDMIQVLLKAAVTQLLAVLWDTGPGTAGHLKSAETAQRAEFLDKKLIYFFKMATQF